VRDILEIERDKAVKEIEMLITLKANECVGRGWNFYLTSDAPETFKDLKEQTVNMRIPIADYGSDKSIYSKYVNSLFRFWHDVTHLELDKGFSVDGEMAVINEHLKAGRELRLSPLAMDILEADTKGQVLYYDRHKEFVDNQKAFVDSCVQHGIRRAIAYAH